MQTINRVEDIVKSIKELPWEKTNPHLLAWAFTQMGKQYAISVKAAQSIHPQNLAIKKLVEEEVQTDNLAYAEYNKKSDHWEFLEFFLKKSKLPHIPHALMQAVETYNKISNAMSKKERAMTVFIHEQRGPDIFQKILTSISWSKDFGYFKHYLERHIEIDAKETGHASLIETFPVDENVAETFYRIRLNVYRACIE